MASPCAIIFMGDVEEKLLKVVIKNLSHGDAI